MSSRFRFLRRVRIHGGECGAVARALHHKARFTLPAVIETVSVTTYERKQMSIKTSFRRIAFAVVVTLSLGMLGTAPASAGTIIGQTMTVAGSSSSAASTIAQGETATVTVVNTFTPESVYDSLTVLTSCAAPAGATCADLDFFFSSTTDSVNATVSKDGSMIAFTQNDDDSLIIQPTLGGQATRFTSSLKFRATTSTTAGNYTVTVYTKSSNGGLAAGVTSSSPSIVWTVTVTAENTTFSSLNLYITPSLEQSAYWANSMATSKDSAIVASNGKNAQTGVIAYNKVAYINVNAKNAAGETRTAANTNICGSGTFCTITATITNGPGLLMLSDGTENAALRTLATFKTDNSSATGATNETLVVVSDGTAGTATITFYNGSTSVGTASVTFTGTPASATSVSLSDTFVAISSNSVTGLVSAVIKDSAGNTLPTGSTVYVFASDTKVVSGGANSTTAAQYTQLAAGVRGSTAGACAPSTVVGGRYSCALTISDTGTSTIVFRDSWTVAASTWVSDAVTVTGLGTEAASVAVAFDKATYSAGELAVITITVTDRAGRANAGTTAFTEVSSSLSLGNLLTGSTQTSGQQATVATRGNYTPSGEESGIETRVVYMPSTSGTVNFSIKYTPSTVLDDELTTVTASAVVTNPAEDAAKAAEVAAAKAGTDAVAAAKAAENAAVAAAKAAEKAAADAAAAAKAGQDAAVAAAEKAAKDAVAASKAAQDAAVAEAQAATDAAAEAIDAANAATDAANLAAEAADAATVAAEEARDAADAATAAVEELATQVATLMAALKAQITTLANTVAKIAKKVKA